MSAVGQVLATVLWLYWVIMIVRLVLDFVGGAGFVGVAVAERATMVRI